MAYELVPGFATFAAALVCEVVMTAMLLRIILGATDRRASAGSAPIAMA